MLDEALHVDVGDGFELEGAPFGLRGVVAGHGAHDVAGPRVVTLDEIGVVRVHGSEQLGQRVVHRARDGSGERGCLGHQGHDERLESRATKRPRRIGAFFDANRARSAFVLDLRKGGGSLSALTAH